MREGVMACAILAIMSTGARAQTGTSRENRLLTGVDGSVTCRVTSAGRGHTDVAGIARLASLDGELCDHSGAGAFGAASALLTLTAEPDAVGIPIRDALANEV